MSTSTGDTGDQLIPKNAKSNKHDLSTIGQDILYEFYMSTIGQDMRE